MLACKTIIIGACSADTVQEDEDEDDDDHDDDARKFFDDACKLCDADGKWWVSSSG